MADPVVVEVDSADAVVAAAERLRAMGYTALEAFTPFPIPELDEALRLGRSKLPWLALAGGVSGGAGALFLQWWTNGYDYPLDVGGRPPNSIPTDVPIAFEMTVLFTALTAFAAALVLSGLPRLHHRVFEIDGFERTTVDRFWIVVGDLRTLGEGVSREEVQLIGEELASLRPLSVRGAREAAQ